MWREGWDVDRATTAGSASPWMMLRSPDRHPTETTRRNAPCAASPWETRQDVLWLGGRRQPAAAIQALIETAKLSDVDPYARLTDVLARLLDHPDKRLDELLPWDWEASRPGTALAQAG